LALRTFGPVHDLNLNLSQNVEAMARAQANPLGWLHKRIAHYLKEALGRAVEFHLVVEEAEGHRLHIHGELQITAGEAVEARAALRKAGGKWAGGAPQHQAVARPNPDTGWLYYLVADLWRVTFTRTVLPRYRPGKLSTYAVTFTGNPTSSTSALNARAAALYKRHRQAVMIRGD